MSLHGNNWVIKDSPLSNPGNNRPGKGMFASKDISAGTLILEEKPLFSIKISNKGELNTPSRIFEAYEKLSPGAQAAYNDLTYTATSQKLFQYAKEIGRPLESLVETLKAGQVVARWYNNAYSAGGFENILVRATSYINSSCMPNANTLWDREKRIWQMRAIYDIPEDAEIFVCYAPYFWPSAERRRRLANYGFECTCAACEPKYAAASDPRREELTVIHKTLNDDDEQAIRNEAGGDAAESQTLLQHEVVREMCREALELLALEPETVMKELRAEM